MRSPVSRAWLRVRRRARWVDCSCSSACELGGQLGDAIADLAAVELHARLARALAADPAALAIAPLAHLAHARRHVLEPHDLDLRLGGARARVAVEDLQDHGGPIHHLGAGLLLEVARLRRGQLVVEQHHAGAVNGDRGLEIGDLAAAQVGAGVKALRGSG